MAFTIETSEDDPAIGVCHVSRELGNHLRVFDGLGGSPQGIQHWAPEFFRRLQVAASLHGSEGHACWDRMLVVCPGPVGGPSESVSVDLWPDVSP
jgi:hypothetical protein